jgi:hypothetical protein
VADVTKHQLKWKVRRGSERVVAAATSTSRIVVSP